MRRERDRSVIPALAAVAAAAVIVSIGATAAIIVRQFLPSPAPEEEDDPWDRVIAYVPLDDRTDNLEDVIHLAEASGYHLLMPQRDQFRTALDGQPRAPGGTAHGDRAALFQWVREQGEAGCRRFVLSLDQLFSGGLVASRVGPSGPLVFSDGSDGSDGPDGIVMDEMEAFETYVLPLADDPETRVYLFDSVLRLSPTVSYAGLGVEEYYGLREYGMVARPALSGDELTLDRIFDGYPWAADGAARAEDALASDKYRSVLTEDLISRYLAVRRRKLSLLDAVMDAVDRTEGFQLLIGVDDSSNAPNIQYNELHYIQRRMGPRTDLMAGLDSIARLLVARIAQEDLGYQVKASVQYVGGTEGRHSSEFDLYTLEEVVDRHLSFFRARKVDPEAAELRFVVMTAPADRERVGEYREELVSMLERDLSRRVPTVLIEASGDAYGDALEQALLERVPFGTLVAFAGKYDQANVAGAGIAMGFSRYLYLRCRADGGDGADEAQVRQMVNSMALTEYTLHVRAPLDQYVEELGLDRNDMDGTDERVLSKLEELFRPDLDRVCASLRGGRLISALEPYREREIGTPSVWDLYFPWGRTFEVAFTVDPGTLGASLPAGTGGAAGGPGSDAASGGPGGASDGAVPGGIGGTGETVP